MSAWDAEDDDVRCLPAENISDVPLRSNSEEILTDIEPL